jgi:glutathione peroxidase
MTAKVIIIGLFFLLQPIAEFGAGESAGRNIIMNSIYDFTMKDINGNEVPLAKYKGNVILVVNVASKCGFTPQYKGLQALYTANETSGFVILGFPANDFMWQEPDSDNDIRKFCSITYGVTFPMFSKIAVKGKTIDPLYEFLTSKETNPEFGGPITWNFNKFLIGRDGRIIDRFDSKDEPSSNRVKAAVEAALIAR